MGQRKLNGVLIVMLVIIVASQSVHLRGLYREMKNDFSVKYNSIIINGIDETNIVFSDSTCQVGFDAEKHVLNYSMNGRRIKIHLKSNETIQQIRRQPVYDIRDTSCWKLSKLYRIIQEKVVDDLPFSPLLLIIEDNVGVIKDRYQEQELAGSDPCCFSTKLGYLSDDTLIVRYDFPVIYFYHNAQNEILLVAYLLLLLVLCVFSLYRDIREEKRKGEYREQFVSAVIHNLQAPVNNIIKMEYLLRKNAEASWSPRDKELYEGIHRQTHKLQESIGEILTLSTDAHGLVIKPKPIDLHDMLNELGNLKWWNVKEGKQYRITMNLHALNSTLNGDYYFLYTSFQNLIENALKYSGMQVNISITTGNPEKGQVQVDVSDDGYGIPREAIKKIFKRHYRIHPNDKRTRGFGLGLPFVLNVVKAHRGKIDVQSTESKGSTFTITLPTYH